MSIQVINSILAETITLNSSITADVTSALSPGTIYTNSTNIPQYVRVSINITSPSSATGQSIVLSVSGTDKNGVSLTASATATPGNGAYAFLYILVPASNSLSRQAQPISGQTIVSAYTISISIEIL